ncbi:ATP-binding protein [Desulfonatronum thiodismutans]|uniref:ATP-binding protein n=1 Tax=Desulfonatronum thiodismutans TaxID=159290 RepID=UPI0004ABDFD2|nr:ATP-binding protein [Desulfonatronum thiodismutans]
MQERTIEQAFHALAAKYPVVTVTGPRQSGKTTLCRMTCPDKKYVNLEAPDIRQFAADDPRGFLAECRAGAILDEIQRAPELLSYLQPLVDEDPTPGRFILTGSQQFNVREALSQSLAGRTGLLTLLPFDWLEIQSFLDVSDVDKLILHGFYPRLHQMRIHPTQAMGDYYETYVQRDVRQLIQIRNVGAFERFVRLCAGRIGQLLNLNSLGNDAGVTHTTAREWISILEASYIIFQLPPWHANISKRLVKTPKIYFWDVGLASYLLGLQEEKQVTRDPLRGSLFENMVVAELFKQHYHQGVRPRLSFYRDSAGNEVDVVIESGHDLVLVEIKAGQTVSRDYFKGLDRFAGVAGGRIKGGMVVFSGQKAQRRSSWEVWPVSDIGVLRNRAVYFFAN